MKDKNLKCEILAKDRIIFSGEVVSVIVPAYDGYLGILKGHMPLIALLKQGIIKIRDKVKEYNFKINFGYLKVQDNNITILVKDGENSN